MKVYLLVSVYGDYEDRTTEFNGIFDDPDKAEEGKKMIEMSIGGTISDTEYLLDIDADSLTNNEYEYYISIEDQRNDALRYMYSYIIEFELNKLIF